MPDVPTILHARAHAHADAHTLARYEATGGYEALRKALTLPPQTIVDEMKASNLRGRGGAGFPCGTKWGFLPPDVRPRYLVINGDESEPGTFKDRELLERDPHQLLEGVVISSYATDVHTAFIYIRGEYPRSARRVQQAVDEAYAAGYLGRDILGSGFDLDVVVHIGAGAYICGEETALLASLQGGRGEPRLKPPFFPATQGLYFKPTIVNNVETISNVPWIVMHGGAAYAAIGPEKSAGTRIFSVSGHVNKPGNYEIAMGITFREFLATFAGGMRGGKTMKAFIPGGASAIWFTDEHLDVAIDIDVVGQHNSMLGSGAITFMDEDTCMVYASHRIVKFFAHESCGQCTPCREGTTWMQQILWRLITGAGRPEDLDLLLDVADNIWPSIRTGISWPPKQTTICPLGPSAVSPVASALTYFPKDFERCLTEGGSPWWRARQARAAGGAVQASPVG